MFIISVRYIFKNNTANCPHRDAVQTPDQHILNLQNIVSFHSKSVKVRTYPHKKSRDFTAPIFMKFPDAQQPYVHISYNGSCPYRTINIESGLKGHLLLSVNYGSEWRKRAVTQCGSLDIPLGQLCPNRKICIIQRKNFTCAPQ
jgi:hypothetical protein